MRRFGIYVASVLMAAVTTLALPAKTEPVEQTLNWLRTEPVTLLDMGMLRLREDLREVSVSLMEQGFTLTEPRVGTYYEWREDTIFAYIAIREPYARPTEQTCLKIFAKAVDQLAKKQRGGPRAIGWYLESLFIHEGTGNYGRPKRMQESLLEAVKFEVSLLPPNPMEDSRKVHCHGRMDAAIEDIAVTTS